jgi:hypothetical protein
MVRSSGAAPEFLGLVLPPWGMASRAVENPGPPLRAPRSSRPTEAEKRRRSAVASPPAFDEAETSTPSCLPGSLSLQRG